MYLVQVSLLLIGQQGLGHFLQVSARASHWLEEFENCTLTPEENEKYSANHQIQAASQSTFINGQLYSTCD
jgi:hypothetical protein